MKDLAPLREEASPPRRPTPGRGRGRPPRGATKPAIVAENSSTVGGTPLLADRQSLSPLERKEFDFTDIDQRQFSIGSQPRCLSLRLNPTAAELQALVKEQAARAKTHAKGEAEEVGTQGLGQRPRGALDAAG